MTYLLAFVVTLFAIGLRGFQQKNLHGEHYRLTFITAYLIAFGDAASLAIIGRAVVLNSNWWVVLASGTGAAIGMCSSMWLHKRFVQKST